MIESKKIFQNHEPQIQIPNFIAFYGTIKDKMRLFALTPRLMQWSQNPKFLLRTNSEISKISDSGIWLFDLRPCQGYWQTQLLYLQIDPIAMLQQTITEAFGVSIKDLCVTAGPTPYLTLLLLYHMQERRLHGFVDFNRQFGQTLFSQISWESWWTCADDFVKLCNKHKIKNFVDKQFKTHLKHMKETIKKLKAKPFWFLQQANEASIKRRFGKTLAMLWQWSAFSRQRQHLNKHIQDFVWLPFENKEKPTVERFLDFPLVEWQHIAPLLQDDFDRLCQINLANPKSKAERILSINWNITLFDLSTILVKIQFRNPHNLHKELGQQKTALLQAHYSFKNAVQELAKQQDLDIAFNHNLPITSWKLSIEDSIHVSFFAKDLFGNYVAQQSGLQSLLELENKLSKPLEAYILTNDLVPENRYHLVGNISSDTQNLSIEIDNVSNSTDAKPCFYAPYQQPLYIYKHPQPINHVDHLSKLWLFIERIMVKWWRCHEPVALDRDYYWQVNNLGCVQWVFREGKKWWLHGIFA